MLVASAHGADRAAPMAAASITIGCCTETTSHHVKLQAWRHQPQHNNVRQTSFSAPRRHSTHRGGADSCRGCTGQNGCHANSACGAEDRWTTSHRQCASTRSYINSSLAAELGLQGEIQKVAVSVLSGEVETFDTMPVEVALESE